MKTILFLSLSLLTTVSFASSSFKYSEAECLKDAKQMLQQNNLTMIYTKALTAVAQGSDMAKGMYLGVQDTTDKNLQNSLNTFCKLQAEAANY